MKNWCILADPLPEISCELKVYSTVEELPKEATSFLQNYGNYFYSIAFLTSLQKASGSGDPVAFVTASQEGNIVAIGVAQLIRFKGTNVKLSTDASDGKLTNWLKRHIGKHSEKIQFDVLVLGIPSVSGEHSALFKPGTTAAEQSGILTLMMEGLKSSLDENVNVLLIKDFYSGAKIDPVNLKPFKYRLLNSEPNLVLEIAPEWKTFEDYISAMTKKYRQRGRKVRNRGNEIMIRELSAAEVLRFEDRIHELYMKVVNSAAFRLFTVPPGYFGTLKSTLQEKMGVYGYFMGNQLMGFRSSFRTHEGLECHYVGFEPIQNREYDLYQNMLFDYVEEGFKNGASKILFGRTAGEMKSNYGAKPLAQHAFVRYNNKVSNHLIKPFVRLIKPEEWVVRNPFKE